MISSCKAIIAVDFDGTIVESRYPKIGKPMMFAFETMKKLLEMGDPFILWTYRSGKYLDEAVEFCRDNGIEFYAINKSYPEEEYDDSISRKIAADIFIDDRNVGGFIGWGEVFRQLINEEVPTNLEPKKGLLSKIFKKK
jgi:hypothetical protein